MPFGVTFRQTLNEELTIFYDSENMTLGFVSFYNIDVCCAVGTNTAPNDRQN